MVPSVSFNWRAIALFDNPSDTRFNDRIVNVSISHHEPRFVSFAENASSDGRVPFGKGHSKMSQERPRKIRINWIGSPVASSPAACTVPSPLPKRGRALRVKRVRRP